MSVSRNQILEIIQFAIDDDKVEFKQAVINAAIEFKYLIHNFQFTRNGVNIMLKDKTYRFSPNEFNYEPLFV